MQFHSSESGLSNIIGHDIIAWTLYVPVTLEPAYKTPL